jgi:preprotein translocase subunit YajC
MIIVIMFLIIVYTLYKRDKRREDFLKEFKDKLK